ncbi:hypothetical protein ACFLVF_01150 [Chloroflexota bacterium]
MKLEDVLRLLQMNEPPEERLDTPAELEELRKWTEELVEEQGREWVEKNRHRLKQEWEMIQGRARLVTGGQPNEGSGTDGSDISLQQSL